MPRLPVSLETTTDSREKGVNGIHRTVAEGLQATWRLNHNQIAIILVRNTSDTQAVVSFDPGPYPDLAEARECFPELTRLWDAVRHEYWAELIPQPRSREEGAHRE